MVAWIVMRDPPDHPEKFVARLARGHHTICTKLHALMSVFKAAGRDNALTGFADVGNSVTAAHGRRRGCVTTVDHL
jgi:hypothetical protein